MTVPAERAARGFMMPRPAAGTAGSAPAVSGPGRAHDGRSPGAGADRAAGAAGPGGDAQEQLRADAPVDLDEEGKALRDSSIVGQLDSEVVGLAPAKERLRG